MGASSSDWVHIGYVARIHGLRGDLIVRVFSANTDNLLRAKKLVCAPSVDEHHTPDFSGAKAIAIASSKVIPAQPEVMVRFAAVNTREAAEVFRGHQIGIARADIAMDDDELLLSDLVGFAVAEDGKKVGHVRSVQSYPASDVLIVVHGALGELEVPYADPYVIESDTSERVVHTQFLADFASTTVSAEESSDSDVAEADPESSATDE